MKQFLIAFDQVINTLIGGWADETISARAWRNHERSRKWHIAMKIINGMFFWQNNHCRGSYAMELHRRHMPVEYRTGR